MSKKQPATHRLPTWGWIGLAVAALAVVAVGVALSQPQSPANTAPTPSVMPPTLAVRPTLPPEISVAQAAQKREQGAWILDVREPSEWAQVHISGATLIPLGSLPERLKEVPADREIVVVCRSGNRSQQGRDILLKAGFTRVTSMAGGMNQWQTQGQPTVSGP